MLVKDLFRLVQEDTATTTTIESQDVDKKLSDLLQQLEVSFVAPSDDADDPNRFEPLLGYNNVSYTLKARQKTIQWEENGPGQRGSRKTSRVPDECYNTASLPVNTTGLVQDPKAVAEAVNAITFDALLGLIRMTVILRGDAVPMADTPSPSNSGSSSSSNKPLLPNLSNLAVRASLDPPRIVFGEKRRLININIGPTSSVVLDATYFDPKARIGMGGTSGTKFVFARCSQGVSTVAPAQASKQEKGRHYITFDCWYCDFRCSRKRLPSDLSVGRRGFVTLAWNDDIDSSGGIERREDTYQPQESR